MELFETFEAALQYLWALPLGVGKIISFGVGGYGVFKVGKTFFGDCNKAQSKTK